MLDENDKQLLLDIFEEEMRQYISDKAEDRSKGKRTSVLGDPNGTPIELNLIEGHYFIEERTPYTRDYVIHKYLFKEKIGKDCEGKLYEKKKNSWRKNSKENRFLKSGDLVVMLFAIDETFRILSEQISQ